MKTVVILFDGSCLLCNAWVRRLCKWDKKDILRFATLDSNTAKGFYEEHKLDSNSMETVVFWKPKEMYAIEAQASFELFKTLGGLWNLATVFRLLPNFVTRNIYRLIARNRYKWFGKSDNCPLPDPKYVHKFLD